MLRLSSDRIYPGMALGRSVVDANGRMLLARGQVLNEFYIQRIKELGIPTVYIEDHLGIDETPPLVSTQTVLNATNNLKKSYQQCALTGKVNMSNMRSQVDNIIDELTANCNVLVGMTDLKSYDEYSYQHSVSVCVLAVLMGITYGYNRSQLQTLGTGAILHDIGKVNVPVDILNKTGSLTEEDFSIIQQHPWDGFKIIKDSGEIALLSAHVALQHHERIDGKGYPRALTGQSIHEYGQITAVADMFDALTSDRPYRCAYNNQEAIAIIEEARGIHLASEYIDLLITHINLYPPGTVVLLTTKDTAIITKENHKDPTRPEVKLLFNAQQQPYDIYRVIELETYKTIFISKSLSATESYEYIARYMQLQGNDSFAPYV